MNRPAAPSPIGIAGPRPSVSIVIAAAYAALPANLVPTIISGLATEFAVPLSVAGASATAMTLANAAAVLASRSLVSRGHRVLVARAGVSLVMLSFIAGAIVLTAPVVIASLIVGGIGSGLVVAAATAAISRTANPDTTTTIVVVTNRIVVALAYLTLPLIGGDIRAILLMMSAIGVIAWCGTHWLPSAPSEEPSLLDRETSLQTVDKRAVGSSAWLLALSFAIWTISEEGTYTLLEVLATANLPAIDVGGVSLLFAVSIAAGLLGSVIAPVLLRLAGRTTGVAVLLSLSILVKLGLVLVTDPALYFACGILWGFAFGAIIPLVFGLAANLAYNGSASVLVNGVYVVGVALGPLVATVLFEAAGHNAFGYTFAALGVLSGAVVVIACKRADALVTPRQLMHSDWEARL